MCKFWELHCHIAEAASAVTDSIIAKWAESIAESVTKSLESLGSIWVGVKTPGLSGAGSTVQFVQGGTRWLVVVLATASIVVAGTRMAWTQRGEPARQALAGMLRLVVVGGAWCAAAQLVVDIGDAYSTWIIQQAQVGDEGKIFAKIMDIGGFKTGGLGLMVIIVGGLIALVVNLVQIALMYVRSALLVLLSGIAPLAAAASGTAWGKAWMDKLIGWFFAFAAFKPVAATVYATALKLLSGTSYSATDEIGPFMMGLVMLVMGAAALPVLIAFMVPATAALGGRGGGGAAAGAALATGAVGAGRALGLGGTTSGTTTGAGPTGGGAGPGVGAAGPVGAAVVGGARAAGAVKGRVAGAVADATGDPASPPAPASSPSGSRPPGPPSPSQGGGAGAAPPAPASSPSGSRPPGRPPAPSQGGAPVPPVATGAREAGDA